MPTAGPAAGEADPFAGADTGVQSVSAAPSFSERLASNALDQPDALVDSPWEAATDESGLSVEAPSTADAPVADADWEADLFEPAPSPADLAVQPEGPRPDDLPSAAPSTAAPAPTPG
jgi:hypothetical protein